MLFLCIQEDTSVSLKNQFYNKFATVPLKIVWFEGNSLFFWGLGLKTFLVIETDKIRGMEKRINVQILLSEYYLP